MCRQSIIEYLKTHTDQSLHADIEDMINKGLVNHALQNKDNARNLYKLLKEVTVCDPAIGSGAFPIGILNILFTTRQHLYGFLNESEPFNHLEEKKAIIRDNIYGVDIEQGAVDIARLRFWLAILVEEQVATPLPNLDYRIVQGNSLITTFNDEYIQLPDNTDGRSKLAKLKKELHQLQNDLFEQNGDEKLQREIEIKCKILEIIKVQLGIDKANALEESRIESDIFEDKKLSVKVLKKAQQARAIEKAKSKSIFVLNNLITSLTTPATSLADRAQIDIKFFDWEIVFSNIFNDDNKNPGFDIVIGNPPYFVYQGAHAGEIDQLRKFNDFKIAFGGKLNAYKLFLASASQSLTKKDGIVSLIFQNSFLGDLQAAKLRRHTLTQNTILKIDSFPERDSKRKRVFESVKMSVCVVLIKNSPSSPTHKFQVNIWEDRNKNKGLQTAFNFQQLSIIDPDGLTIPRLERSSIPLVLKLLKKKEVEIKCIEGELNMTFHKSYFTSKTYMPMILKGAAIQRYRFTLNMSQGEIEYLNESQYLEDHGSSEKSKHHLFERIAMQGMTGANDKVRLVMSIVPPGVYLANSCNYLFAPEGLSLKTLLGILNSKLINWFFRAFSTNSNVNGYEVDNFPIPKIDKEISKLIESLVSQRMNKYEDVISIENKIDHIAYHLYDLTYDDVLIIDPQTPISREEYESLKL